MYVLCAFQGCLNDFTGVSCQRCFKCVLKKLQGYFKSASNVVERKITKCSKEVSSLFQRNSNNVSIVFQSSFKGVSRKFCFLILHGTHRSYPSRRRACFYQSEFFQQPVWIRTLIINSDNVDIIAACNVTQHFVM